MFFRQAREEKSRRAVCAQFAYIRPLATIEPTAIRLSLPVCTDFRDKDIVGLQHELTKQQYHNERTHICRLGAHELARMVQDFVAAFGGNPPEVSEWPGDDYDSLYVLRSATRTQEIDLS